MTLTMQGSGSFSVESMIGTAVPRGGKLLVLANGAYGDRLAKIASYLEIDSGCARIWFCGLQARCLVAM